MQESNHTTSPALPPSLSLSFPPFPFRNLLSLSAVVCCSSLSLFWLFIFNGTVLYFSHPCNWKSVQMDSGLRLLSLQQYSESHQIKKGG